MVVKTSRNESFFVKAFVLAVIGDFPAVAELVLHKTHASLHGCRICTITGQKSPGRRGFSFIGGGKLRNKEGFEVSEETEGIKRATPLRFLKCFDGPAFFGLDELHLWGHNVAR
ncbi:unnamed protein product [Mucor hiemalis]